MDRGQGCPPGVRPRRLCAQVLRFCVVLATTTGGAARAGYIYDLTRIDGESGPPTARVPDPTRRHDGTSPAPTLGGSAGLDEAVAWFRRADYARCLDLLKAARGKDPELLPARVLLAQWFLRDDQVAPAREALERAAVEEPGCPQVYLLFGRLAIRDGRAAEAAVLFEKALALADAGGWSEAARKGFRGEARANLADLAERRGDWPTASACLAARLELEPGDGRGRCRLARALFRQGRREGVLEQLRRAAGDDPALDPPAIMMARLYTEAGEPRKAAEWVEYAVKAAPRDPKAHLGAALWYLEQDRLDRARALVEAATTLDPGSADVKAARGVIAWHAKDYPEAERIFREIFNASPGDLGASNLWALSLAEQPSEAKRRRALQLAEANARMDPNSPTALTTLGRVYYRNGRPEDAERALRAALARGPDSTEAPYYLARVLADRGRTDEVGPLLRLCLDAPGRSAFRVEAREWLAKVAR